ncbi:YncE family protein [Alkalitalea saponilacus]|uniref:40-residue YVTN family beta-propeller repeat-containing protein n=1 Tax=Alkalitalea saponilacus TaxID=889453 RepID=A0A1T5BUL0_9BACT|nr:DUF5074 domain-containing protein [Alkalitalea saponilacus]ASB49583.1 hypothetical protein CDL62_10740 [Alkalitalea saponilacus]SKB51048.1 hypothetical protein SAMN03080601_00640 [Alkalitalea saponilacus]
MKRIANIFTVLLAAGLFFSACTSDDDNKFERDETTFGCYIVNYGSFGNLGASITRYDYKADTVTNGYFERQNNGFELLSNIQYANVYNGSIYMMGNERDEVITTNLLFQQTENGISEGIAKPRFFVGNGDYIYVSCWGSNPDWGDMVDTYIAKIDTRTNEVVEKIDLPGGPEGLAIANGHLYAALNFRKQVAVIDLNDYESITYIETPGVTSYFIKDASNNLYVTLLSSFTQDVEDTGMGYINTATKTLEEVYSLDGISSSYGSVISPNNDFSTIYVIAASWVEVEGKWEQQGGVFSFDVASKSYSPFISNLSGMGGVMVNPDTDEIYLLTSSSTSESGKLNVYNEDGTFIKDIQVGRSPAWAFFMK